MLRAKLLGRVVVMVALTTTALFVGPAGAQVAPVGPKAQTQSTGLAPEYNGYTGVSYSAPANVAELPLGAAPSLDITKVSYGYDGQYLRFTMTLQDPSNTAPAPFQEQDFAWRFTVDGTQVVVELLDFYLLGFQNQVDDPDNIGITADDADTLEPCLTCYARLDPTTDEIQFFVDLTDFNTALDVAAPSLAEVGPGSVFHLIEADTYADIGPDLEQFPADTAAAPKKDTFKIGPCQPAFCDTGLGT